MDRLNIITFNDDNHAERVWINGLYVGTSNCIANIIQKSVIIIKDLNDDFNTEETNIWTCDDFEDVDEETVDYIWDFFNNVEKMNEDQIKAISDRDWEKLRKLI